jgi:peptide/nickel transport system ATP-binding protein
VSVPTPLLSVEDLTTSFATERGIVTAVDGISLHVNRGEILGLVGESGCGKSVTANSIMRLLDERTTRYSGAVKIDGRDLLAVDEEEMRHIRGKSVAMIFQDPMTSLNPLFTVGSQIVEAIRLHQSVSKARAREIAIEMLAKTRIPSPAERFSDYPHQLSGGMRQRVMIAMALACNPKLLIADEPTTALDVTTQAQILQLVSQLKDELQMGTILITHDLGVVASTCDRVAVMYLGQIVEQATVEELFARPRHPYTRGLLKSMPKVNDGPLKRLHVIRGNVPSLQNVPAACRFSDRCDFATEVCKTTAPPLEPVNEGGQVRCWHHEKIAGIDEKVVITP